MSRVYPPPAERKLIFALVFVLGLAIALAIAVVTTIIPAPIITPSPVNERSIKLSASPVTHADVYCVYDGTPVELPLDKATSKTLTSAADLRKLTKLVDAIPERKQEMFSLCLPVWNYRVRLYSHSRLLTDVQFCFGCGHISQIAAGAGYRRIFDPYGAALDPIERYLVSRLPPPVPLRPKQSTHSN